MTTATHKLVDRTGRERRALFDVRTDQRERNELDDAELLGTLGKALEEWAAAHHARAPTRRQGSAKERRGARAAPADEAPDPEAERERRQHAEELRSLGYAD